MKVFRQALMIAAPLIDFFASRREREQPMALATVVHTKGSTYSKSGAMMLIDEHGIFQGMLSGGCLEGDLAIRAQQVIASQRPQRVTYDLAMDNEELWGLGVGCDGLMEILVQPLLMSSGYEPMASILDLVVADQTAELTLVIESSSADVPLAASSVRGTDTTQTFGTDVTLDEDASGYRTLSVLVQPAPRILVLGAGLDAEPLVRLATEMGWRCTVVDHRPGYFEQADFSAAVATHCCTVDELPAKLALDDFDAAVVMSHHLTSDRGYLRHLAGSQVPYIGLLGPPGRRDRLLTEIGDDADALRDRMRGPAGIELGGRGPSAIALSIVAEIQAELQSAASPVRRC
ncbi:MAG: XdhC family protein [Gammaproteobacteria bacterium]|nr:XdhC family protein [Gammaproteobacteria bacterium]